MKKTNTVQMFLVTVISSLRLNLSKGSHPLKDTIRMFSTLEEAKAYGKRAAKKVHSQGLCNKRPFVFDPKFVQIMVVSDNAAPKVIRNAYSV
ncbi:MAG: hypothetical protein EBT07_14825 [Actinobacteria bacterium]|nr:hypothetical protein [Actinomycetota bacterium]